MKAIVLAILLCLITPLACAEKVYVFIDKIGYVQKGEELGHTAYGDVVTVAPYTSQYKPTRAELDRYKVIVVDLTQKEQEELLEPDWVGTQRDWLNGTHVEIKARKRKVDIDNMSAIKQEEEIAKTTLTNNISVKSLSP